MNTHSTNPEMPETRVIDILNKLTIITAAVEDIIKAGFSVSSSVVKEATDVAAVVNNIVAEGFYSDLKIHKMSGEILGELEIFDAEDNEVFGHYFCEISPALQRAFGLINQANDHGTCFE